MAALKRVGVFNPIKKQISEDITVYGDKKIQFRDTGMYIQSSADGKLLISSDGTGADDITLTGNVTVSNDLTISGSFSYGAVTATSFVNTGTTQLGDNIADAVTFYGSVAVNSAQNPVFDWSDSTGAFSTGTGTVTLNGTTSLVADKNIACVAGSTAVDWSLGTGIFKTTTGANTLNGDTTITGAKTFTTGTGNVTVKGDISIDAGKDFDMSAGAGTFATGTGDTTVGGNLVLSGHKDSQTFMANNFACPNPDTDWTPSITGCSLGASLTAKKVWIPLNFLKLGDEIVSYKIVGDATEADAITLDCKLVSVNKADPITQTYVTGGNITQVDADGNFDSEATLSAVETVVTDKQYYLEIAGTTGTSDALEVMGAEVLVNRK